MDYKKIDNLIELLPAEFLENPFLKSQKENPRYIENYYLLCLQELWLTFKDKEVWNYMWELCFTISKRIVGKMVSTRKLIFTPDEKIDASIYACEYLLRRYKGGGYIKDKPYKITASFPVALKDACRHALFYSSKTTSFLNDSIRFEAFGNNSNLEAFLDSEIRNNNPVSNKVKIKVNVKKLQKSPKIQKLLQSKKV